MQRTLKYSRRIGFLAVLACVSAGSGCASMNNTEKGAAIGGVAGAGVGTAIGAATGHPALGAALGTATGVGVGALAGNGVDRDEAHRRELAQAQAVADQQYQQQRMTVDDVIVLSQSGQKDQIIINQIRSTRSTFTLSVYDLERLQKAGVSDAVIAEMQLARAPVGPPTQVIVQQPRPAVVVEPAPVVVRPAPYYYYGRPYHRYWW